LVKLIIAIADMFKEKLKKKLLFNHISCSNYEFNHATADVFNKKLPFTAVVALEIEARKNTDLII